MFPIYGDRMNVDRCVGPDRIYFDEGQLETLLGANKKKGFFYFVKKDLLNE